MEYTEKQNILVVEDNENTRRLLETILRGSGYEVTLAPDAEEGLRILEGDVAVDLVLLDLFLSDSQGIETLQRLVLAAPHIPILVIGDWQDQALAMQAITLDIGVMDGFDPAQQQLAFRLQPLGRTSGHQNHRCALRAAANVIDEIESLEPAAAVEAQQSQQVQSRWVMRIAGEDSAVGQLCFGGLAVALKLLRLQKYWIDRCRGWDASA